MLDYNVIRSGSNGNAVRIEDIMIDCGIPFKDMKEDLYKCKALLLTHAHSDHMKKATIKKINEEFPRIRTYANPDVAYRHYINNVINVKPFKIGKNYIIPFEGKHDVPVTYFLIQRDDINILYATDTCEISVPEGIKIDYFFLESNYDEVKLRETGKSYKHKGYDPRESNLRHLSTQQAKAFYYMNRRNKDSPFIELHKSSRFY